MNEVLKDLIQNYPVLDRDEFLSRLESLGVGELIKSMEELLTMYYNDLNSSSLREIMVVRSMGFEPNPEKIGYNGYRRDFPSETEVACEAKPKNIRTGGTNNRKLDGGGNFTDYSWQKFERHLKENPTMLIAGFIDGKIIYIFQFLFNTDGFVERIREQLERHFPGRVDVAGKYLRSASFSFKHYGQSPEMQTRSFVRKEDLDGVFKDWITSSVKDHLRRISDG